MKKLIILILLLPLVSYGQAFKGAKKIIIKTGLPAKESFDLVANQLLDSGFEIQSKDNDLMTIRTYEKPGKGVACILNIRVKDDEVSVKGMFRMPDLEETLTEIVNRGMSGSAFKRSFDMMDAFAASMKKPVLYE